MSGLRAKAAWWNDARYLAVLILVSAVPLSWPALPPLTDALGHLARYHVETSIDESVGLQRHYRFDWALIGNLGVDLLIVPLTRLLGVELATKIVVVAIPTLTALGLVLVAVQVHGRAPPTTAFALPLAYGFPLQFGFLNYCLSVGLALIAFAGWIALGRSGRRGFRAVVFVPIGLLLWLCHVFGWALLAVMVAAFEFARAADPRRSPLAAVGGVAVAMLPLTPPIALMLAWRSGSVSGDTGIWFNLPAKLGWLSAVFRDRWEVFDRICAGVAGFVAIAGIIERRVGCRRELGLVTLGLLAAFLLLPYLLLGSAYADARLAPLVMAMALVALKVPRDRRWATGLAIAALAFFLVRTAATTISFMRYDRAYQQQIGAIAHIARGSRVIVFVGAGCESDWFDPRMAHLGGLATVRRDAFVNDQWSLAGAQLLTANHPAAGAFQNDPSQIVRPRDCATTHRPVRGTVIPEFPRPAFDYLWLINLPGAAQFVLPGLTRLWSRADGALYRIDRPARGAPAKP